jgi:hypothetical protein
MFVSYYYYCHHIIVIILLSSYYCHHIPVFKVTRLRAGRPSNRGSIAGKAKHLSMASRPAQELIKSFILSILGYYAEG